MDQLGHGDVSILVQIVHHTQNILNSVVPQTGDVLIIQISIQIPFSTPAVWITFLTISPSSIATGLREMAP